MKIKNRNNVVYFIGESAKENWELLDVAKEEDYFFHLSSFPSCYVIMKNNVKEDINNSDIKYGAELCLEHTKYKNLKDIYVDFTKIKNVKKGKILGEIYYLQNKKISRIKAK